MLASPKARDGLRNFVTEWLRLGSLDRLEKDAKLFTTYTPDLGPMAREETLRVFEDLVFDRDDDVRTVFTTRRTFVTPKLASMYQVPAPSPTGFAPIELPADGARRGLLGQISILALYAHPTTSSSATLRGKFVREKLLCQPIPPPPVGLNTAIPEPDAVSRTLRQRVKVHLTDAYCNGCHSQMDPIGLGLESFDGIGRFRTKENGGDHRSERQPRRRRFHDGRRRSAQAIPEHPSSRRASRARSTSTRPGFASARPSRFLTIGALSERFVQATERVPPEDPHRRGGAEPRPSDKRARRRNCRRRRPSEPPLDPSQRAPRPARRRPREHRPAVPRDLRARPARDGRTRLCSPSASACSSGATACCPSCGVRRRRATPSTRGISPRPSRPSPRTRRSSRW